jgi:bacteriocin-like protein
MKELNENELATVTGGINFKDIISPLADWAEGWLS